jgi:hypothetical protein
MDTLQGIPGQRNLQATSVGHIVRSWLADGPVKARVHGVFRTSFNVLLESGFLVTFLDQPLRGPANIVVPGLDTLLGCLEPGQLARLSLIAVVLPEPALCLDLSSAQLWRGTWLPAEKGIDAESCRARIDTASKIAAEHGDMLGYLGSTSNQSPKKAASPETQSPMRSQVRAQLQTAIQGLCMAALAEDVDLAFACAQQMIGLGPGLTPSGDDFLSGFLLALQLAGCAAGSCTEWLERVSAGVSAMAHGRTTLVSSTQLCLAAQGEADEVTGRAITAILWGEIDLNASAKALLEVGSTSGSDILAGINTAASIIDTLMPHACA